MEGIDLLRKFQPILPRTSLLMIKPQMMLFLRNSNLFNTMQPYKSREMDETPLPILQSCFN